MSLLYLPYREIGVITNDSPVHVTRLGNENFLSVAIGESFQIMKVDKLNTCLISKPCDSAITHVATKNNMTFVATKNNKIVKFKRTSIVCELGSHDNCISGLHCVGDILVSTDIGGGIQVFDVKTQSCLNRMQALNGGKLVVASHPPTYVNKFVFGFSNGSVELWNIRSGKCLYSFQSHLACLSEEERNNMGVTCIASAPAVDVMAFGLQNGHIFVVNIKLDQILFHFKQVGEVTGITFRTDAAADECPFLVSSSSHGHLYTWKIGGGVKEGTFQSKSSKLINTIKRAHEGKVLSAQFLFGEPLLVTAGTDNAVKVWIFDNADGSPRLLRSRQGHAKYAADLSFYGDVSYDSQFGHGVTGRVSGLLSSDAGNLMFTRLDRYGIMDRFSAANIEKNDFLRGRPLSSVLSYDVATLSGNKWGNLVSLHRNSAVACVWKVEDKAATSTLLSVPSTFHRRDSEVFCSAVACSPCGNFAVVGYENGWLCKYNLQSGLFRGSFPKHIMQSRVNIIEKEAMAAASEANLNFKGHQGRVCGVFVDATNAVIVSASADGLLCFWSFHDHRLLKSEYLSEGIERVKGHRDSGFFAVVTKGHAIRVYDVCAMRLTRVFVRGHEESILSLCFTPDARRLLSSCAGRSLRVWDMATGRCVSWAKFATAVTSMCFTPTGDLVLSRMGERGLLLAVDRSLTDSVSLDQEPTHPVDMTTAQFDMSSSDEVAKDLDTLPEFTVPEDPSEGLRFSTMPKAYWSKIFKFESLRKKNVVAPIKKSSTPFFLGNVGGPGVADFAVASSSVKTAAEESTSLAPASRLLHFREIASGRLVKHLTNQPTAHSLLQFLMSLSPSDVESEFRLLCPFEGYTAALKQIQTVVAHFNTLLKDKAAFELVQAYLHCFLTIHGGKIMKSFSMKPDVQQLALQLRRSDERLNVLLHTCLCLIKVHLDIQLL